MFEMGNLTKILQNLITLLKKLLKFIFIKYFLAFKCGTL